MRPMPTSCIFNLTLFQSLWPRQQSIPLFLQPYNADMGWLDLNRKADDISWYFTQFDGLTKAKALGSPSFQASTNLITSTRLQDPSCTGSSSLMASSLIASFSRDQYIPVHQSWSSDHPMFRVAVKTLQKHLHLESWLFLMGFRMFYSPK